MAQPMYSTVVNGSSSVPGASAEAPAPDGFVSVIVPGAGGEGQTAANESPSADSGPLPWVQTPIVASRKDGSHYPGDLLGDILDYRDLRWRSLRGECTTANELRHFHQLEHQLRQAEDEAEGAAQLRMFYRFECEFAARLIYQGAHGAPVAMAVTVQDISAGGVKIATEQNFTEGERVELLMSLQGSTERVVNLPGRIAWTRAGVAGLMFAGAPT